MIKADDTYTLSLGPERDNKKTFNMQKKSECFPQEIIGVFLSKCVSTRRE